MIGVCKRRGVHFTSRFGFIGVCKTKGGLITLRFGFIGVSTVNPYMSFGAIVVFTGILYVIVWFLLSRGIRLKP